MIRIAMLESTSNEGKSKSDESTSEKSDDSSPFEEVEPKLKYERLSNDLQSVLQKDAVSCVAFHPKIICIGTRWGLVYVLDHQGNLVRNELLRSHTVAVNQISMDTKGDFIATCSDDGKAYVYGLYTQDHQIEINVGRCVKSVAIDPYYYKEGKHRRFVTGDDRLVLHEKTFLSRVRSTVLFEAVGKVQNIKWKDRFIAWSCDVGVRLYDVKGATSLVLIKWNRTDSALPENYPCCLSWKNDATLLIGWVDTIRVCRIEKRNSVIRDVPEFTVSAVSTFQIDYYISGVCPLDSSQLVILAYVKKKDENNKSVRPQMYILQAEDTKYVEVNSDNLTLRGYQDCVCNDYHLDYLVDENRFIITSPKDVVIASIYDVDDRIEWLVSHKKFEEAMELVTTKDRYLQRNNLLMVGKKYMDHLLNTKEFDKAGELCAKILGTNKELWEKEVFKFARFHKLRAVSRYLPTSPHCKLDPHIYEMVLYEYLKMEPQNFLEIIKEWSPSLYNVDAVTNAVMENVIRATEFKNVLLESLGILYTHSRKYDKALNIYLKLKHKDAFALIETHKLYSNVSHEIENLMDLDSRRAIAMFMKKDTIAVDSIVSNLQHNQYYLYLYLDALDTHDFKTTSRKYHAQLVKLYANFAPHKLLPLLRRSNNYPIQEALSICKERNLYKETVYLLGLIGNTKEALQLLMNKIGDMEQAIDFCKERNDPDLWEELVDCSLAKPEFVTYLMQKISSYVDPRILVQRIAFGYEIPGLKNSLVKMLRDYNLQVSVKEGCTNIIVSDCFDLLQRLMGMQQRGLIIDDDLVCCVCQQKQLTKGNSTSNVLMFYCRHSFHEECLPSVDSTLKCIICCSQKSGQSLS